MSYDTDIFIIRKIINKECNNLKITLNKNIIDFNEPHDWYFTDGSIKHTIYYVDVRTNNPEDPDDAADGMRISPNDQDFLDSEPINLKSNDLLLEKINRQTNDRKTRLLWCLDRLGG